MLEPHDRGDEEWSIVVPREEGHLASGLGPGDRGQAQGPPVIVTDEFLFRESHVARWCATNSVPPTVANSHVFAKKISPDGISKRRVDHKFPISRFVMYVNLVGDGNWNFGNLATPARPFASLLPLAIFVFIAIFPVRYNFVERSQPAVVMKSGFWQKFSSYGNKCYEGINNDSRITQRALDRPLN